MSKWTMLKKILPPEEKVFYDLFERGADVAYKIALHYNNILEEGLTEEKIKEVKALKHQAVSIDNETFTALNSTFITPIDREDIQLISSSLEKISKRTVRACVNLRVYRLSTHNGHMKKQSEALIEATTELKSVFSLFKTSHELEKFALSNQKMDEIETKGDEILYEAMDELFSGQYDALTVIKLRDIYKSVENALDTCFSASDTLVNAILKQT